MNACAGVFRYSSLMRSEEMKAKARECAELAAKAEPMTRMFYEQAAQQWLAMAEQMGFLEQESVYRIIRNRK
ncbi:hypothetical protein BRAS3843_1730034 [Bradyrhizobium sp. STM 3843]|nr:hypothetical protein BRAS3843_1730034 [Bradyrhizobium sp. STM 3843]